MELIKQNSFTTCGQACIAMIANKSIETVIHDMKTDGPTSIGQLIDILDRYGIVHAERNTRISKKILNQIHFPFLLFIQMKVIHIGHCCMTVSIMIRNLD